jgi:hypothetical protein
MFPQTACIKKSRENFMLKMKLLSCAIVVELLSAMRKLWTQRRRAKKFAARRRPQNGGTAARR